MDDILNKLNDLMNAISGIGNSVSSSIQSSISEILSPITSAVGAISNTLSTGVSGLGASIDQLRNYIESNLSSGASQVAGLLPAIQSTIQGALSNNVSSLSNLISGISNTVTNAVSGLPSQIANIAPSVQSIVSNSISSGLGNISSLVSNLSSGISGEIQAGQNAVSNALNNATGAISNSLQGGLNTVNQLISNTSGAIQSGFNNGLTNVLNTLGNVGNTVTSNISNGLASVQKTIGDTQTSIEAGLQKGFSDLGTLEQTLNTQITQTLGNLSPSLKSISDAIANVAAVLQAIADMPNTILKWSATAKGELSSTSTKKERIIKDVFAGKYGGNTDALITDLLDPEIGGILSGLIDLIVKIYAGLAVYGEMAHVLNRVPVAAVNENNQTEILTPEILATMVVQGVTDQDSAKQEAAWSGINANRFDALVRVSGNPTGLETTLEMLNRGFIDEAQARQAIVESRLKPKYTDPVLKLKDVLPSVSDMVRMAQRKVFTPEIAEKFSLFANVPDEFITLARQAGLTDDWAKRFWASHWELPSFSQATEMLWRSPETGVTTEDVKDLLFKEGMLPFWADRLIKISFQPFTRVDVRRMYKIGILSKEQVKRAYLDIGYDDKRAQALTDFTIKYEDEIGQQNPDALERKEFDALLQLYLDDKRTDSDLATAMQSFGWTADVSKIEMAVARLKKEHHDLTAHKTESGVSVNTLQREIVNGFESLYAVGQRSLNDLENAMRGFKWGDSEINLELQIANLKKELHYKPSRHDKIKDLTVSSILDAMANHVLSESDALTQLKNIGLSESSAQMEIANKKYEIAAGLRKQIVNAVRESFLNGEIDESGIAGTLGKYRFTADEISSYSELWTLEKGLRVKRISESQLASMLKHGVISTDEYTTELKKMGYSDIQVTRLVKLRGGV